jgi:hypothetical protein
MPLSRCLLDWLQLRRWRWRQCRLHHLKPVRCNFTRFQLHVTAIGSLGRSSTDCTDTGQRGGGRGRGQERAAWHRIRSRVRSQIAEYGCGLMSKRALRVRGVWKCGHEAARPLLLLFGLCGCCCCRCKRRGRQ